MKRLPVFVLCVAAALGLSALVWPRAESAPTAAQPLVCLVGGTMTPVFNELAWAYEKQAKQKVEITSADSGELLASIEMQLQGDLYVAHDPFMDIAMRRGLGVNAWCVAELVPVMIVQKGNPRNIHSLRDLLRPDVRVYLPDYQHSTLGYLLPIIFRHAHVDFDELNRIKQIPRTAVAHGWRTRSSWTPPTWHWCGRWWHSCGRRIWMSSRSTAFCRFRAWMRSPAPRGTATWWRR